MARDVADLVNKIGRVANAVDKGRHTTITQMALAAKDEFAAGPPRVGIRRGAKLAGAKWGAKFNVRKRPNPTALISYRGPLHWIQGGTKGHFITPKGFAGSRSSRGLRAAESAIGVGRNRVSTRKVARGGRQAMRFADGNVRRSVFHPGARAKPFFGGVKRRVRVVVPRVAESQLNRNIIQSGWGRS